ncbi:nucleotidyltransferase family protein [Aerococcaceae bacterium DSM 111176]|nr:nucleotidyltransferase family protein [Aerococcaceae bacterium DSM 111176]
MTKMLNVGSSEFTSKKVLGIITEYNPFHFGHEYQLHALREKAQADVIIVLMSGNVVQRGEYAITSKWARAEAALSSGADLVLEAPLVASLQSADYFAAHNVRILHELDVNILGFGTETANESDLLNYVHWHNEQREAIDNAVKRHLAEGFSYPASYQKALDSLNPPGNFDTTSPNHLLGIQYVAYNETLDQKLDIVTLPRAKNWKDVEILSGSQIRQALELEFDKSVVPEVMASQLEPSTLMNWNHAFPFLKFRLAQHTPDTLQKIWGVREGIENLILRVYKASKSYDELISNLVSKRWSKASIQRILMAVLLDFQSDNWQQMMSEFRDEPTVQILGFTDAGRSYLNHIKNQTSVNIISNINQSTADRFQGNLRADAILEIIQAGKLTEQNFTKYPIVKIK